MSKVTRKTQTKQKLLISSKEKFVLKLFVSGNLPNSARAIKNITHICEKHLNGRYTLEIIDIYDQPKQALAEDVIIVPVLIKKSPLPEVRIIGDLSEKSKVLQALGLI